MSTIILFPSTSKTFTPRVEVRDVYRPGAESMSWVVEVLDWNGRHKLEEFADTEQADLFAEEFRINFFQTDGSAA